MASFNPGPGLVTPVGRNEYLRSDRNLQYETYQVAASTVPEVTLPTGEVVKVLQPGTVMARITSGVEAGRVGPYAAGLSGGFESAVLTLTSVTAGTFTLTVDGEETADIAYNATAAQVQSALEALDGVEAGDFTVTKSAAVFTILHNVPGNAVDMTADVSGLTGGSPGIAITQGSADELVADGRQTAANIVGINDTYLPTQLLRRNVEIAVLYHGTCVQQWCIEHNSSMQPIALTDATADAMRGNKALDLMFVPVNPEVV